MACARIINLKHHLIKTMIIATLTIAVETINEQHDTEGMKICNGVASIQTYSKDGPVTEQINYRCRGAGAVQVSAAGTGAQAIAIGYVDFIIVNQDTYKEKIPCLVIDSFIPSQSDTLPATPTPDASEPVLAGVSAAVGNGSIPQIEDNTDTDIPF
ncbi:hypothetical protein [Chroococcidiopsis thermalis]|uniref:Uncharacterized protein n=1 Tax=Chroococcidiopsis thermalis (strain PCC 7203) TaxID=251229 RepID=K9UA14_CHRTP|nr:hypothetical protein [Chroococcidiopsis thermalis]AFY91089.1 hypothetical protein Chro_5743 [Chroococcidiopsis thermalis PCC 7203]